MHVVVYHASGRLDVEEFGALKGRSLAAWRAGAAPAYCVVGVAEDLAGGMALLKGFRAEERVRREAARAQRSMMEAQFVPGGDGDVSGFRSDGVSGLGSGEPRMDANGREGDGEAGGASPPPLDGLAGRRLIGGFGDAPPVSPADASPDVGSGV